MTFLCQLTKNLLPYLGLKITVTEQTYYQMLFLPIDLHCVNGIEALLPLGFPLGLEKEGGAGIICILFITHRFITQERTGSRGQEERLLDSQPSSSQGRLAGMQTCQHLGIQSLCTGKHSDVSGPSPSQSFSPV